MKTLKNKYYCRIFCRKTILFFCILLIITILLTVYYNAITPVLLPVATQKLDDMLASSANSIVNTIEIGDLIEKKYNKDGKLSEVNCSSLEISKICNRILTETEENLLGKKLKVKLPIGTLTGSNLLSDKGVPITVCISQSHNISANAKSTVEPYAINQSIYKLYIEITFDEIIILPGAKVEFHSFEHIVPVYETIIIGEIPSTYIKAE